MSPSEEPRKADIEEVAADTPTDGAEESAATEPADVEQPAEGEETPAEPDPLEAMTAERADFEQRWLRSLADLDNLRKRSRREVADARRFARAEVLRAMLQVQDDFDRALQSAEGDADTGADDGFRAGVELIFQRLQGALKDQGVEPIAAQDEVFDPAVHEAVGQQPREGVEAGVVIEVVQPGFKLEDMVLRPARVIISA